MAVVPLSPGSRFPNHYVQYEKFQLINARPEDPSIRRDGDYLKIVAAPKFPKLGFDTTAGWMAYLMKNDVMFVKQYRVFPERRYNEVAGLTMSIWYPANGKMVELEPIGPAERLAPNARAAFTEVWTLLPQNFPDSPNQLNAAAIAAQVGKLPELKPNR